MRRNISGWITLFGLLSCFVIGCSKMTRSGDDDGGTDDERETQVGFSSDVPTDAASLIETDTFSDTSGRPDTSGASDTASNADTATDFPQDNRSDGSDDFNTVSATDTETVIPPGVSSDTTDDLDTASDTDTETVDPTDMSSDTAVRSDTLFEENTDTYTQIDAGQDYWGSDTDVGDTDVAEETDTGTDTGSVTDTGADTGSVVEEGTDTGIDTGSAVQGTDSEIDTGTEHECVQNASLCDDGNACTEDICDPVSGCLSTLVVANRCRPNIEITYPQRAATIEGSEEPIVMVTGTVSSGAGPIVSFTLNGEEVSLDSDGAFSHSVTAQVGGNILVFDASDDMGAERHRVQSFLWSTVYHKTRPSDPMSGFVSEGMSLWLDQTVIDDGEHNAPVDDLATAIEMYMGAMDLNDMITNPVERVDMLMLGEYDMYLNDLVADGPQISLNTVEGGLALSLMFSNVTGDLAANKGCTWTESDPDNCLGPDTVTGDMTIGTLSAETTLLVSFDADTHAPIVTATDTIVDVTDLDVNIDGTLGELLDFVLDFILEFFIDGFEGLVEAEMEQRIGPAVETLLAGLNLSSQYDVPRLDGSDESFPIFLETDINDINFNSRGGIFKYRTKIDAVSQVPYDNLGAPGRVGCGVLPQTLVVPIDGEVGLSISDDTLTQLFYAAWLGGLLEFSVPEELLGVSSIELSLLGIEDLEISLSGMLAPTPSDCGSDNNFETHIGDLRVDISMTYQDQPLDVVAYASLAVGMAFQIVGSELHVVATGLERSEVEVAVVQQDRLDLEDLATMLVDYVLVSDAGLASSLDDDTLFVIPMPSIPLDAVSELPPGSAIIVTPETVNREQGNTLVTATASGK